MMKTTYTLLFLLLVLNSYSQNRKQISLNGRWKIAKTSLFSQMPNAFSSEVPVPGLVDLAEPALDTNRLYNQGVYWYKTNFTIKEKYPELVQLKIEKVKYRAKVFLNKKFVGEQIYCFTPAVFNIREYLNPQGKENELLIGVGTVNNMPDSVIWGHDFEKLTYIPGIYDNTSLLLSNYPFIRNIQVVPMISDETVRILADVEYGKKAKSVEFKYIIKELKTGKVVAHGKSPYSDFTVHLPGCRLWTPESPNLYELTLSTDANEKKIRFGMRSFSFDAETKLAMLNGKPYYMRGTNVCIFRFFEDSVRGTLPWDNNWVIRLHQQFKSMHWNSMRYCIGFPPERWYEIADSLGFLIQDEYPVWADFKKTYPKVTARHLANEYKSWMQERWNHPSVVIWDAQNESVTPVVGEAIAAVRGFDFSNRPWENGWSPPQLTTDPVEEHPYLFNGYRKGDKPTEKGPLYDKLSSERSFNNVNRLDKKQYANPRIINEYEWLWLNRDGTTTTLTDKVYDVAFGKNLSKEERVYLYNRYIGMITEYWRCHRVCAGVLHFCGLGYSRPYEPRGQTSDNFVDVKNLTFNPLYVKYVKPAFSPVALMINYWEKQVSPKTTLDVDIYVINDLNEPWTGPLKFVLLSGDRVVSSEVKIVTIPALGREIVRFHAQFPDEKGPCRMDAGLEYRGEQVNSLREILVKE
jgi:hypothetical protein